MLLLFLVCFQMECLSGLVSVEVSEGGIWHQTQWIAHHLQCSREAKNVGEVPQFIPLKSFVLGPGLEEPWLQGQSILVQRHYWSLGKVRHAGVVFRSLIILVLVRNWLVVDTGEHFSVFKVQCFEWVWDPFSAENICSVVYHFFWDDGFKWKEVRGTYPPEEGFSHPNFLQQWP